MKHSVLALIIALLSGAVVTLILIPFQLTNTQLWVAFFAITVVVFSLGWIFNEYLVFRDMNKLKILVKNLENRSKNADEFSFSMHDAQVLGAAIKRFRQSQNVKFDDLNKKSNLRRQFIADVSHELKSPLFSAQGYVHTLLDGAFKDKEVRNKFLRKAARNLDYIDILIQDLLTLSQIESEAIRMIPDHFNMISLAEEIIDDRESKANKASVTLELKYNVTPIIVFADYSRIMQVMINLVNNGINHNKPGGKVVIEINELDDQVSIVIADDGEGIAEKYHERIFNRFFRIDKSRTVKKSTGLGLAIVKHILERHNSHIKLESEPGKGAKFSFLLPRDKWTSSGSEV